MQTRRLETEKSPPGDLIVPAISEADAAEKLAKGVEMARPTALAEIYSEFVPEWPSLTSPVASDIAKHIRNGLEPEEIVDLWNIVFPEDRNVWYNEETKVVHFNEELVGDLD
jgi:hypothetical protein